MTVGLCFLYCKNLFVITTNVAIQMWTYFFDQIYLINLSHRTDRLLDTTEQFELYEIPYKRVEAVYNDQQGAEGLRDTMLKIFQDATDNNYERILVFEDDVQFVVEKAIVDATMQGVLEQLPDNFLLLYLGGQPTAGFSNFYTANLLPAIKYFATHAVAYSRQAIKEIMARGMGFPIDNWLVDNIQTLGNCYTVHPLIASQRPGMSDIGKTFIDWRAFIEARHEQKINELQARW